MYIHVVHTFHKTQNIYQWEIFQNILNPECGEILVCIFVRRESREEDVLKIFLLCPNINHFKDNLHILSDILTILI